MNGLAGFRFALRQFLSFSEAALSLAGVTSHQYQAMLVIRVSETERISIKELAAELLLRPNGAVQLVDRLVALDMVGRSSSETDRRSVLVSLTTKGKELLDRLAAEHLAELVRQRPLLVDSLRRLTDITT